MPNAKALDQLLTAAWQRMARARERWEKSWSAQDYHAYCRTCAYVDALEDAKHVYRGGALPEWVELVRMENIRGFEHDEDAGVTNADPS